MGPKHLNWIRVASVTLLLCSLLIFSGCAVADAFFGANGEGSNAPVHTVGAMADAFFPWSSTILGTAGWIYSTIRGRRYKQAGMSMVEVVRHVLANPDQLKHITPQGAKELLDILDKRQVRDGTYKTIAGLRKTVEKKSL